MKKIVIVGASGHGKVVADIARLNGYKEIVFLDDNKETKRCGNYSVVGTSDLINELNCDFIVAIGNPTVREKVFNRLMLAGKSIATLIHPDSVIGENVIVGEGTVVMAGAVINPCTTIGKGCIINTCSSVDHDNCLDDFVHVSVGAHIAGTVSIDARTWVGAGATVINNINITKDCMIGAGAVVVNDIETSGTYIGVPAKLKEKCS